VKTPYTDVIAWFDTNDMLELNYTDTDEDFNANLLSIKPLVKLVDEFCAKRSNAEKLFCMELVLWSLSGADKLDKTESDKAFQFDATGTKMYYGDN
jgi:magnesium chelatase subunit I